MEKVTEYESIYKLYSGEEYADPETDSLPSVLEAPPSQPY
jgi:hypothetical protein